MSAEEYNNPENTENSDNKPRAYKVEDDDNIEEKDLKRTYLFGNAEMADPDTDGYESEGSGGENFGKSNVTTSGDDAANPSRYAGYSNDYFKRTEPSEEHPENSNFKPAHQEGAPTKDGQSQSVDSNIYQEGTADYDGGTQQNAPGNANPVQNKVGDGNKSEPGKAEWNTDYERGPDYGSNSPEERDI
ncbi:hypothetical protein [Mucilaginibacter polytrichastri]|uniref:Uncharacterized protein n=1 Tax=Mucilaginibacter polytrichastri TaxID=1302689 RepID=A0A1Q5ZXT6_9SPHI|nr:hypothetical protein [Mucilaginibacter polytrichastri]OKS86548.1 hypothetical protein RG47T_2004 [Mucilaginibacter polytrichastri]SFS79874.1 hypothetical protein SAMN04487890_104120 [Mucilaginibacter polytrichastri]